MATMQSGTMNRTRGMSAGTVGGIREDRHDVLGGIISQ